MPARPNPPGRLSPVRNDVELRSGGVAWRLSADIDTFVAECRPGACLNGRESRLFNLTTSADYATCMEATSKGAKP